MNIILDSILNIYFITTSRRNPKWIMYDYWHQDGFNELDIELIKTKIYLLLQKKRDSIVTITGGEPLLYSRNEELIEDIKDQVLRIRMISNGILTVNQSLKLWNLVDEWFFLLDLRDMDTYKKINGVDKLNNMLRNINIINIILENNRLVNITFLNTRFNFLELEVFVICMLMIETNRINIIVSLFVNKYGLSQSRYEYNVFLNRKERRLFGSILKGKIVPLVSIKPERFNDDSNLLIQYSDCLISLSDGQKYVKKSFKTFSPITNIVIDYNGNKKMCYLARDIYMANINTSVNNDLYGKLNDWLFSKDTYDYCSICCKVIKS